MELGEVKDGRVNMKKIRARPHPQTEQNTL